ncbi:hypothetical protein VPH1229_0012 [Vibrio phage 1229]
MGRMATHLQKPVFEIKGYPESELSYWAAFFSIQDNGDKPIIVKRKEVTVEQSIADMRSVLS